MSPTLASRLRLGVTRLARKLRREADTGITPTLLAALSTIERHGPVTAGMLATHEQVEKPTVTSLLAVLEERELIQRTSDPLDGRVTWVQISLRAASSCRAPAVARTATWRSGSSDSRSTSRRRWSARPEILDRLAEEDR